MDKLCRNDLSSGIITSERDYVSTLNEKIRNINRILYNNSRDLEHISRDLEHISRALEHISIALEYFDEKIHSRGISSNYFKSSFNAINKIINSLRRMNDSNTFERSFVFSRTTDPLQETKFGCDAMVMIRTNKFLKVGLFEAKWPRLKLVNYNWDSIQKKSGISHFSDQLDRQSKFSKEIAIWEMFLNDFPSDCRIDLFDPYGSTCITHEEAFSFDSTRNKNTVWTHNDLKDMLRSQPMANRSLQGIILKMLQCKIGKPFPPSSKSILVGSSDDQIEIPTNYVEMGNQIPLFMEQYGLGNFIYLEY